MAGALVPGSKIIPRLTGGATDARYFRWKGVPSYGFALHSLGILAAETEDAGLVLFRNELTVIYLPGQKIGRNDKDGNPLVGKSYLARRTRRQISTSRSFRKFTSSGH